MNKPALKLTSVITALAFSLTQLAASGYAAPPSLNEVVITRGFEIQIPEALGTVDAIRSGSGPAVIHIQTAHGNYDAQKKIQGLLRHLKSAYGIKTLLLEGSPLELRPEMLRFFPEDMDLTMKINDGLTRKALVKGAELFLVEDKDAKGYGIEERETFLANGKAFREVLAEQEKTGNFVEEMNLQIERLASAFLGKDVRTFLKRLEAFEKGEVPFQEWLKYQKDWALKTARIDVSDVVYQIDWPMMVRFWKMTEFEKRMDWNAYPREREKFLKELKRFKSPVYEDVEALLSESFTGNALQDRQTEELFEKMVQSLPAQFDYSRYPNLKFFIGHLLLQSELKAGLLADEMDGLSEEIIQALAQSPEEQKLTGLLNDYRLLQKLFSLQLTPGQYEMVLERKDNLIPEKVAARFLELNQSGRVRDIHFPHTKDLGLLFEKALEFYRLVKERDIRMSESIARRIKESGADKVVVITGGFHAEPFQKFFEDAGFSYARISPKIENFEGDSERSVYVNSILQTAPNFLTRATYESLSVAHSWRQLKSLGFYNLSWLLGEMLKEILPPVAENPALLEALNQSPHARGSYSLSLDRAKKSIRITLEPGFINPEAKTAYVPLREDTKVEVRRTEKQILVPMLENDSKSPRSELRLSEKMKKIFSNPNIATRKSEIFELLRTEEVHNPRLLFSLFYDPDSDVRKQAAMVLIENPLIATVDFWISSLEKAAVELPEFYDRDGLNEVIKNMPEKRTENFDEGLARMYKRHAVIFALGGVLDPDKDRSDIERRHVERLRQTLRAGIEDEASRWSETEDQKLFEILASNPDTVLTEKRDLSLFKMLRLLELRRQNYFSPNYKADKKFKITDGWLIGNLPIIYPKDLETVAAQKLYARRPEEIKRSSDLRPDAETQAASDSKGIKRSELRAGEAVTIRDNTGKPYKFEEIPRDQFKEYVPIAQKLYGANQVSEEDIDEHSINRGTAAMMFDLVARSLQNPEGSRMVRIWALKNDLGKVIGFRMLSDFSKNRLNETIGFKLFEDFSKLPKFGKLLEPIDPESILEGLYVVSAQGNYQQQGLGTKMLEESFKAVQSDSEKKYGYYFAVINEDNRPSLNAFSRAAKNLNLPVWHIPGDSQYYLVDLFPEDNEDKEKNLPSWMNPENQWKGAGENRSELRTGRVKLQKITPEDITAVMNDYELTGNGQFLIPEIQAGQDGYNIETRPQEIVRLMAERNWFVKNWPRTEIKSFLRARLFNFKPGFVETMKSEVAKSLQEKFRRDFSATDIVSLGSLGSFWYASDTEEKRISDLDLVVVVKQSGIQLLEHKIHLKEGVLFEPNATRVPTDRKIQLIVMSQEHFENRLRLTTDQKIDRQIRYETIFHGGGILLYGKDYWKNSLPLYNVLKTAIGLLVIGDIFAFSSTSAYRIVKAKRRWREAISILNTYFPQANLDSLNTVFYNAAEQAENQFGRAHAEDLHSLFAEEMGDLRQKANLLKQLISADLKEKLKHQAIYRARSELRSARPFDDFGRYGTFPIGGSRKDESGQVQRIIDNALVPLGTWFRFGGLTGRIRHIEKRDKNYFALAADGESVGQERQLAEALPYVMEFYDSRKGMVVQVSELFFSRGDSVILGRTVLPQGVPKASDFPKDLGVLPLDRDLTARPGESRTVIYEKGETPQNSGIFLEKSMTNDNISRVMTERDPNTVYEDIRKFAADPFVKIEKASRTDYLREGHAEIEIVEGPKGDQILLTSLGALNGIIVEQTRSWEKAMDPESVRIKLPPRDASDASIMESLNSFSLRDFEDEEVAPAQPREFIPNYPFRVKIVDQNGNTRYSIALRYFYDQAEAVEEKRHKLLVYDDLTQTVNMARYDELPDLSKFPFEVKVTGDMFGKKLVIVKNRFGQPGFTQKELGYIPKIILQEIYPDSMRSELRSVEAARDLAFVEAIRRLDLSQKSDYQALQAIRHSLEKIGKKAMRRVPSIKTMPEGSLLYYNPNPDAYWMTQDYVYLKNKIEIVEILRETAEDSVFRDYLLDVFSFTDDESLAFINPEFLRLVRTVSSIPENKASQNDKRKALILNVPEKRLTLSREYRQDMRDYLNLAPRLLRQRDFSSQQALTLGALYVVAEYGFLGGVLRVMERFKRESWARDFMEQVRQIPHDLGRRINVLGGADYRRVWELFPYRERSKHKKKLLQELAVVQKEAYRRFSSQPELEGLAEFAGELRQIFNNKEVDFAVGNARAVRVIQMLRPAFSPEAHLSQFVEQLASEGTHDVGFLRDFMLAARSELRESRQDQLDRWFLDGVFDRNFYLSMGLGYLFLGLTAPLIMTMAIFIMTAPSLVYLRHIAVKFYISDRDEKLAIRLRDAGEDEFLAGFDELKGLLNRGLKPAMLDSMRVAGKRVFEDNPEWAVARRRFVEILKTYSTPSGSRTVTRDILERGLKFYAEKQGIRVPQDEVNYLEVLLDELPQESEFFMSIMTNEATYEAQHYVETILSRDAADPQRGPDNSVQRLGKEVLARLKKVRKLNLVRYAAGYVGALSKGDDFPFRPNAFLVLGNPVLDTYLQFAPVWKFIRDLEGFEIPIVLAGGIGRGTLPLAEAILEHYSRDNRLSDEEKQFLERGIENFKIFLTDKTEISRDQLINEVQLMRMALVKEGVSENFIYDEERPSTKTAENFQFSESVIREHVEGIKNPVIGLVTAPHLLLRAKAFGEREWKAAVENEGWQVKRFKTFDIYPSRLSPAQLIELLGYASGYPQKYVQKYPALSPYSELKGFHDVLGDKSPLTQEDWDRLDVLMKHFEDFLDDQVLDYDPVHNQLVPRSELRSPLIINADEDWTKAVADSSRPNIVEVGFGQYGNVLSRLAYENPDKNYFGIENEERFVKTAAKMIEGQKLLNVRLVNADAVEAFENQADMNEGNPFLDAFHLFYPFPSAPPSVDEDEIKSKTRERNFFNRMEKEGHLFLLPLLRPGALIRVATENSDLALRMRQLAEAWGLESVANDRDFPFLEDYGDEWAKYFRKGHRRHELTFRNPEVRDELAMKRAQLRAQNKKTISLWDLRLPENIEFEESISQADRQRVVWALSKLNEKDFTLMRPEPVRLHVFPVKGKGPFKEHPSYTVTEDNSPVIYLDFLDDSKISPENLAELFRPAIRRNWEHLGVMERIWEWRQEAFFQKYGKILEAVRSKWLTLSYKEQDKLEAVDGMIAAARKEQDKGFDYGPLPEVSSNAKAAMEIFRREIEAFDESPKDARLLQYLRNEFASQGASQKNTRSELRAGPTEEQVRNFFGEMNQLLERLPGDFKYKHRVNFTFSTPTNVDLNLSDFGPPESSLVRKKKEIFAAQGYVDLRAKTMRPFSQRKGIYLQEYLIKTDVPEFRFEKILAEIEGWIMGAEVIPEEDENSFRPSHMVAWQALNERYAQIDRENQARSELRHQISTRDRRGYGLSGSFLTSAEENYEQRLLKAFAAGKFGLNQDEIGALVRFLVRGKEGSFELRNEPFFPAADRSDILNYRDFDLSKFVNRVLSERDKYLSEKDSKGKALYSEKQIHKLVFQKLIPLSWIKRLMADGLSRTDAMYIASNWANPAESWSTMKPVRDELVAAGLPRTSAAKIVMGWSEPKETWELVLKPILEELMAAGLSKTYAVRVLTRWEKPGELWEKTLRPIRDQLMRDGLSRGYATRVVVSWKNPKEFWESELKPVQEELMADGVAKTDATMIVIGWSKPKEVWENNLKPIRDELMSGGLSKTEATRVATRWKNPKEFWEKNLKPIRDQLIADGVGKTPATRVTTSWKNPREFWRKELKPVRDELAAAGLSKTDATIIVTGWSHPKDKWENEFKPVRDELMANGFSKTEATFSALVWTHPKERAAATRRAVALLLEITSRPRQAAMKYFLEGSYKKLLSHAGAEYSLSPQQVETVLAPIKEFEETYGVAARSELRLLSSRSPLGFEFEFQNFRWAFKEDQTITEKQTLEALASVLGREAFVTPTLQRIFAGSKSHDIQKISVRNIQEGKAVGGEGIFKADVILKDGRQAVFVMVVSKNIHHNSKVNENFELIRSIHEALPQFMVEPIVLSQGEFIDGKNQKQVLSVYSTVFLEGFLEVNMLDAKVFELNPYPQSPISMGWKGTRQLKADIVRVLSAIYAKSGKAVGHPEGPLVEMGPEIQAGDFMMNSRLPSGKNLRLITIRNLIDNASPADFIRGLFEVSEEPLVQPRMDAGSIISIEVFSKENIYEGLRLGLIDVLGANAGEAKAAEWIAEYEKAYSARSELAPDSFNPGTAPDSASRPRSELRASFFNPSAEKYYLENKAFFDALPIFQTHAEFLDWFKENQSKLPSKATRGKHLGAGYTALVLMYSGKIEKGKLQDFQRQVAAYEYARDSEVIQSAPQFKTPGEFIGWFEDNRSRLPSKAIDGGVLGASYTAQVLIQAGKIQEEKYWDFISHASAYEYMRDSQVIQGAPKFQTPKEFLVWYKVHELELPHKSSDGEFLGAAYAARALMYAGKIDEGKIPTYRLEASAYDYARTSEAIQKAPEFQTPKEFFIWYKEHKMELPSKSSEGEFLGASYAAQVLVQGGKIQESKLQEFQRHASAYEYARDSQVIQGAPEFQTLKEFLVWYKAHETELSRKSSEGEFLGAAYAAMALMYAGKIEEQKIQTYQFEISAYDYAQSSKVVQEAPYFNTPKEFLIWYRANSSRLHSKFKGEESLGASYSAVVLMHAGKIEEGKLQTFQFEASAHDYAKDSEVVQSAPEFKTPAEFLKWFKENKTKLPSKSDEGKILRAGYAALVLMHAGKIDESKGRTFLFEAAAYQRALDEKDGIEAEIRRIWSEEGKKTDFTDLDRLKAEFDPLKLPRLKSKNFQTIVPLSKRYRNLILSHAYAEYGQGLIGSLKPTSRSELRLNTAQIGVIRNFRDGILPYALTLASPQASLVSMLEIILDRKVYAKEAGRIRAESILNVNIGTGAPVISDNFIKAVLEARKNVISQTSQTGSGKIFFDPELLLKIASKNPRALFLLISSVSKLQESLKSKESILTTSVTEGDEKEFLRKITAALRHQKAAEGAEISEAVFLEKRITSLITVVKTPAGKNQADTVREFVDRQHGGVALWLDQNSPLFGIAPEASFSIGQEIHQDDWVYVALASLLTEPAAELVRFIQDPKARAEKIKEYVASHLPGFTPSEQGFVLSVLQSLAEAFHTREYIGTMA